MVLRDGRVEQTGAPMHLYNDPDNTFVGGFIGSPKMNFLNATVVAQSNGTATVTLTDYTGDEFSLPCQSPLNAGDKVQVGIRPEHFTSAGNAILHTHIEVVESLGGLSYGYADAESEAPLTMALEEHQLNDARGDFTAHFNTDRAFLFDTESTQRIR